MHQLPLERDLVELTDADLELVADSLRRRLATYTEPPALMFVGSTQQELDWNVAVADGEGARRRPLLQLTYHSPAGFAWGYGGSGPADLAMSILHLVVVRALSATVAATTHPAVIAVVDGMTLTDEHAGLAQAVAWRFHHDYKFEVIAGIPQDASWSIREADVAGWLLEQLPPAG